MNKLNTDVLLFLLSIALCAFTVMKLTDPKDFIAFLGMVASYKFGRSQGVDKPVEKSVASDEQLG